MQKSIKSLFQPFQSRTRANRFSENYFLWIRLVSNIVILSITLLNIILLTFLIVNILLTKKVEIRHLPIWLVCSRELDVLFGRRKREVRFDEDPRSGCRPDDPFERGNEESDGNCKKKIFSGKVPLVCDSDWQGKSCNLLGFKNLNFSFTETFLPFLDNIK